MVGATRAVEAAGALTVASAHDAPGEVVQARETTGAAAKQAVKCAAADAKKGSYTANYGSRCCSPCSNQTSVFWRDSLTIACGVIVCRIMSLPFQCSWCVLAFPL
jgi:hypothetical protein